MGRPPKGKYFYCDKCKTEFYRHPCQIKRGEVRFCSRKCSSSLWKGRLRGTKPLEGRWKVGRKGYVQTTIRRKRILQHRYVIEQAIGRELLKDEIVHHLNGVKADNRIENLEVVNIKTHKLSYGDAYVDGYKKGYKDAKSGLPNWAK